MCIYLPCTGKLLNQLNRVCTSMYIYIVSRISIDIDRIYKVISNQVLL